MEKKNSSRKAFSLVELVVVILIIGVLAVAVFAGGSSVIKRGQISRTTSDLHNFSVAVEAFMNENPSVANIDKTGAADNDAGANFGKYLTKINALLAADYALNTTAVTISTESVSKSGGNITVNNTALGETALVFESKKTDAWGNHYYAIIDSNERHGVQNSDFYIYIVSAGPDAKVDLGGKIGGGAAAGKEDDIFLLVQYKNGDVSAVTYNMADSTLLKGLNNGSCVAMSDEQKKAATYCNGTEREARTSDAAIETLPVNF